ncbi:UvrD-helicase domain-containing protein [Hahella sp. HN01]|uniref:UvrD-helicase domain-containing protein n=1 Tax=Hahella sp. HN01 TaxID=2847262 RepID=UPI001C1EB94B|nr:UvrD-helicase domain-containing protein [Hahella sp. HN01]MBU6953873.1 AAA family ATPase [Hahella sp. HN01]
MSTKRSESNKNQYFIQSEVVEQSQRLFSMGGKFQKAANEISNIIFKISSGDANPLQGIKLTNHGESRIKHCIKYQLAGACRLVTIQNSNKIFLVFFGKHEETDSWLDRNRGVKFVADDERNVTLIRAISETREDGDSIYIPPKNSQGYLHEKLKEYEYDFLVDGIPRSQMVELEKLTSFSTDDEIQHVIEKIDIISKQCLIFDVILSLRAGEVEAARSRIAFEKGDLTEVCEAPIKESETIQEIPRDDLAYAELFSHFIKTADYRKWMLFMHPDQRKAVEEDFPSSAKLLGISGSGKTCIVVKRAIRLAERYTGKKILIVTLNRSLAKLISELVDTVISKDIRNRIHVLPFFKLCQQYLMIFEPGNDKLYDDKTWKSEEHIDEIWTEFYRCELNNRDAHILQPVHDYLLTCKVNPETYIRAEFDWIRSAFGRCNRNEYFDADRKGRSIPMKSSYRQVLLEGLSAWEKKMKDIGVTDYLGVATALYCYIPNLTPDYRCTLIDEYQDFGTTEMAILRKITDVGDNDLFICGDAAQRVSTKFQSLLKANINIPLNSSKKIFKNYRNSKEILSVSHKILTNGLTADFFDSEDLEFLDPEYSTFSGSSPLLLEADSLEEEISYALEFLRSELEKEQKGCIAICGYSLYEVQKYGVHLNIPVLEGDRSQANRTMWLNSRQ